ncbi:MAG: protein kinase, partial [Chloroflexota bacterium]
MSENSTFGTIVKERRTALGLTQTELARRVGCAPVTIRKIEYDALRPSVQIAEHLAVALNIPDEEHLAFIRLARRERDPSPIPTPPPTLEEIGQEDLSGRAIKGFALGERIGAGGYGAVYRAAQATVERDVAIKIILPKYADRPEFIRRFEAEAQLVARLEHPHIVPLYDYWREPGVAYLVMRFLRGGSLADKLQVGPLGEETLLTVLEQICAGLHAAHRVGVIHRDIKPANILLDEDGNAYLADFGIAKNLSDNSEISEDQLVIGSPAYISPEQIMIEPVKPQTDIYSLGVMLYELLTGKKPFKGPSPIAFIQQHLNEQLPLLHEAKNGDTVSEKSPPTPLDIVIGRATAKEPGERYPDILSMLADIRRAFDPESTVEDVTDTDLAVTTPPH